jgi:uncharacterized membrane protein (DUF373 family)
MHPNQTKIDQYSQRFFDAFLPILRLAVSAMIFLAILALLAFMAKQLIEVYQAMMDRTPRNFLHDIAIIIVMVKAFRILVSYLQDHHISIKYIVEISIIAPAVELIFAADKHVLWLNVIFAAFSVSTMIVYYGFYDRITKTQ